MRVRAWAAHVAALVGYALLTVVMTWPLASQVTTAIPGDGFDGWQNYWNLWWVKVALVERIQNPYLTDLLYYPTGVGLYFHTLNPFNGLATLPVQLAAGLIPAYNAVVLISWVLAGYGTFLLTLWVMRRRNLAAYGGAFVAGLVFTFAPVHMAHLLGHMQVMALQWLPFYALALLRGIDAAQGGRPWSRIALLAGLYLIFAGLCDWYFVLYLLLFTGVAVVWSWVAPWSQARGLRRWWAALAVPALAGLLFALVLGPILVPMVIEAVRYSFMVRPSSDLYILSASLSDFLIPNRLHTFFRPDSFTWPGNQIAPVSERTIATGYGALVLAGVGLAAARARGRMLWAVAALFFVLMALGPRLHLGDIGWEQIPGGAAVLRDPSLAADVNSELSPYALVNRLIPFMRISRSVSRFAIMVQLSLAVLAGVGLAWGLARLRRGVATGVAVAVTAVILSEYWVAPYPLSPPDTPDHYHTLAAETRGDPRAVLNLPMNYDRPGYLLYQTVHQQPLTVAYISRDDPRTLTERVPFLQHLRHLGPDILADDPAQVALTVLNDLDVGWVILDRYKMPGGAEREVTTTLAEAAFAGIAPVYEDARVTVYTVPLLEFPMAYLELGPLHWGPLQQDADGAVYRRVDAEPALLTVRHAVAGSRVAVTYRSVDGSALTVTADGVPTPQPVAEEPTTITLPLGADGQITLHATGGQVHILNVALLPAP